MTMKYKTYYHVTLYDNLKSIIKDGLIPKIGPLSKLNNENIPRIYLFSDYNSMEDAMMNWLGDNLENIYGENKTYSYLEIKLPNDFDLIENNADYEVCTSERIPPDYIKHLKNE